MDRFDSMNRRQMLNTAGAGALAISAGGLLVACGGGSTTTGSTPGTTAAAPAGTPKRGGTLRAGITGGGDTDNIDPLMPLSLMDFARVNQLYEGLTYYDREAKLQNRLAEEFEPNKDATVWTIRVKKGIEFHNGKELTAEDVVHTFHVEMSEKKELYPNLLALDTAGIKAVDKYTVRVPCKSPLATLAQLCGGYFNIIPKGWDPKKPVGTGPYKYVSFTPGQSSRFTRNDNYWVTGQPHFDEVIITNFPDEQSQVNALLAGQVDVINSLSSDSIRPIESGGKKVLISDAGGFTPFTMRVDVKPYSDVRVRQAFRLIVDRPQMLDLVFGGNGTIANDIFSPYDPAYDKSIPQREVDVEKAKSLLKAAGYENLSVELISAPQSQGLTKAAQVFAQQAKAAGVNVKVRNITITEMFGPNFLQWPFSQDYWFYWPYLAQVSQSTLPTSGFNTQHFDNPKYNALYKQALGTTDQAKQTELIHEMQMIDYEDGGYIIPYFPPVIDGHAANVQGVVTSKAGYPLNTFAFKDMWFS